MKNIFTKIVAIAATSAATVTLAAGVNNPAQAADFHFNWQGDDDYSAISSFSYDEATAPTIISESSASPTNFLQPYTYRLLLITMYFPTPPIMYFPTPPLNFTLIDENSASTQVSSASVPEPTAILGLLALSLLGIGSNVKKKNQLSC
ncbi:MAG: PEP-CTERM sorting domain-containing protein [Trichormus sp.]